VPSHLVDLADHLPEQLNGLLVHLDLLVGRPSPLELLLLLVVEVHPAAELLRADHDALGARGHLERVVLHVLARPAEDRVQQLLLRRQLALGLGADLADEDVAGADAGADADDAVSSRFRSIFSLTLGMSA
jgi:hypothetical protein